ncbi:GNAT family N-acetyltransferase [Brachybacterium sp. JHP9]|uniref:GNAT family N-acetyltransferase n=1 Tax=Brachybacterium equifaecis TaxID=2910770 RepID=A0ABT0QWU2_9MICO|nr:GNAT family N-acetyltransferase [Brachybacterium equifaecis]MCL6421959.1 GNAT family N-acetyltransferase [Brachybacterium equifaecis]
MPQPIIHPAASAPDPATGAVLRRAHVRDIDPRTVYLLAKLRQDVFTMEQKASDPDLDGRDLESGTTLLWVEVPGEDAEAAGLEREPAAHIRVLTEPDGSMRIGRLAVRAQNRRDGFGGRIMRAALDVTHELAPEQDVNIDAQAYLEQWYIGMGYETTGPVFMEAGIEHVPMRFRHPRG